MNHWKKALTVLFLSMILAACGTAEGEDASEIFKQAEKASDSIESVAMEMEMSQEITTEGDTEGLPGGNMSMDVSSSGEMQFDPLILHQSIDMETMMGEEMPEIPAQTMEQYVTEDAMYMTNPMGGEWVKAPEVLQEQLNTSVPAEQQAPGSQLDMFKEHISDFSLEESEDHYKMSVSATGEEMESLMQKVMEEAGTEMLTEDMMKNTTINSTDITFTLNKETYYPETVDMKMDITVEEQGQTINLVQDTKITYSDYNEISELSVPDDVVNNAKEMEIPEMPAQ
ncbi:DUF6612 family protein [Salimicrobium halophilum]|uniref:Lipoprotein n=1 Tax=Salimicrobium halophilum TaxID=86666 RepID=A0A1G8VBZ7_9BACI|nr:DUF6612 family protein [Salimicrobium halophilum]SDJ63533.1 hypothetical protein SAMN04490247_2636 [Salimicrobium halophilum]